MKYSRVNIKRFQQVSSKHLLFCNSLLLLEKAQLWLFKTTSDLCFTINSRYKMMKITSSFPEEYGTSNKKWKRRGGKNWNWYSLHSPIVHIGWSVSKMHCIKTIEIKDGFDTMHLWYSYFEEKISFTDEIRCTLDIK